MNRRHFLKTSSLSALACTAYLPACDQNPGIPIIDTHQHLWDLDLFPLEWVSPPLDKSFVMEDYLLAVKGQNVTKAIYMEVGAPAELKRKEAEWALNLCKDPANPTVAAVISADATDKHLQVYLNEMEGNPYLKGIRYPFSNVEEMLQAQVVENLRFLGGMGLSFDLNISPSLLADGGQLLDKCPDTRFILNHCGNVDPVAFFPEQEPTPREPRHNPDQWYHDMDQLAKRDNIICKISGIVDNVANYPLTASHLAPIINHCFDVFGPDRVIFASDWPVCLKNMPLAQWIGTLKQVIADRPQVDQRKFFHDNAFAFYGLKE
jgi:predicted TIM-barrel fold metal-dependent hydrolase